MGTEVGCANYNENRRASLCRSMCRAVPHSSTQVGNRRIGADSAHNMIAAARLLPFEHMRCIAHILQRSITVSLSDSGFVQALSKSRKIVGHFKHSPTNTTELQAQQAALGQKQEPLVQDVPTRWNSTVDMVKRLNRNQAAIKATLDQQQHKLIMLTPPEWDKVQRLETLLEPCR